MATPFGELLGTSTAEMEAELADYVRLGVDWLRIDLHWDSIQRSAGGRMDWSLVDKVFNAVDAAGIEIVAVLNNTPDWVGSSLSSGWQQRAFGEFAGAAAARYGNIVDYWEILNEPNKGGVSPESYSGVLRESWNAIKAVDSNDVIISGGTAAVPQTGNGMYGAVDYLQRIYASGGGDYFDAVGYHPYTFPLFPGSSQAWNGWQIMEDGIRDTMIANGDADKKVWMTELGAPTWGQSVTVSQADQARILREAVDLAQDTDWAGPIMWFSYQDSTFEPGFGLVGADGAQREAYWAFRELGNADNVRQAVSIAPAAVDLQDGTGGADRLSGMDGDSVLNGLGGNDTLLGHGGDDHLAGGSGNDVLTGASGSDVFLFAKGMGWDKITDFTSGQDVIDLSAIDADSTASGMQAFDFIGGAYLREAGDLGVYVDHQNARTYVQGDLNGDRAFDFSIRLNGVHALSVDDFIL